MHEGGGGVDKGVWWSEEKTSNGDDGDGDDGDGDDLCNSFEVIMIYITLILRDMEIKERSNRKNEREQKNI